jgi:hypothetical protein
MTLDSSKLPSDGLAPLGLGLAIDEAREHTTVDIFEQRLRTGVHPIPASMRRQLAAAGDASNASHPTGELERIEAENVSLLSVPLYACERDEEEMPVGSKRAANGALPPCASYTNAAPEDERTGAGGGFSEFDGEEEARRKQRALEQQQATEARKAERRRCAGCRRFACIC